MNSFFRWATSLVFGAVIAYVTWTKEDVNNSETEKPLQRKYGSVIAPNLLMTFILLMFAAAAISSDVRFSFDSLFPLICGVFISMGLFFALFILLLPVLRKYVSAKAIALMWLLPNYLYITVQNYMVLDKPRFVVDMGNVPMRTVSLIWISAAALVFTAYVIRHFIFRFKLLRHAKPLGCGKVLFLWEKMQTDYEFKKPCIKIVTSANTATPISVGLFRHTMVLVLPHTDYTEDELKLIFKHELIHIIRSDSQIKLFIAFCNAVCWFNPLMWIAMKKCSEDLELSCDEYVIEDCSKVEKDLYGNLILSAVGNETGFTTCLSAGAEALKYRLTNIYKPKRRFKGSIIVGTVMAAMLLLSGNIAFSYNHQSLAEVFAGNVSEVNIDPSYISMGEDNSYKAYYCNDPDVLDDYLMDLSICQVSGYYSDMDNEGKHLYCHYQTDKGLVVVCLDDNTLEYSPLYTAGRKESRTYYLDEAVDWDHIMSIISLSPLEEEAEPDL